MKSGAEHRKDNTELNMSFFSGLADFEYIKLRAFEQINIETGDKTEVTIGTEYKVIYVASGTGNVHFGKETVNCSCGDVFVVSKGIRYYIEANTISKMRIMCISFEFTKHIPYEFSTVFDRAGNKYIGKTEKVKTLMRFFESEYSTNESFASEVCESIAQIILVDIWRKLTKDKEKNQPVRKDENTAVIVKSVVEYIEENIGKVTVSDIAEKFPYNGSYISRLFKQQLGMPLKEYIITVNMKRASELLEEGNKPLSKVAKECGYDSVPTFCRTLKKYTGTTSLKIKRAGKVQK